MDHLLRVLTGISLLLIGWVLFSLRRAHIRVEHSVSWLAAGTVLLVLSRWRALDELLSRAMGINDIPITLLVVIAGVFLIVLYRQSLRISGLKDSNVKLAQKIAILEYRVTYGNQPNE
jgi:hypothetical protein